MYVNHPTSVPNIYVHAYVESKIIVIGGKKKKRNTIPYLSLSI